MKLLEWRNIKGGNRHMFGQMHLTADQKDCGKEEVNTLWNTAGKSINIRWEKNKINSGWCIRVRKMSGSINNLLKVKSVRYDILFSLKG